MLQYSPNIAPANNPDPMMTRTIPLVNLHQFETGDRARREDFVAELGSAFRDIGFVGVTGHGITKDLIDDFYRAAKQFFALPTEVKRRYEVPGAAGQRGYTSFGKEHAKHSQVADLKEFYQIDRSLADRDTSGFSPNGEVSEAPGFLQLGSQLYKAFEAAGASLLRAIALYLGLEETYFEQHIEGGVSILRAIHYPPITEEPKSAIRAEQHEDINLITLLVGASAGGLQLQNTDGEWQEIVPENDEIVINVGDMLQRLTNNYLKSTTHRVVNPPREQWHEPRLSIPFFLHPKPEMRLDVLPSTVTADRPRAYAPITAGEYLDERLREIGLKK